MKKRRNRLLAILLILGLILGEFSDLPSASAAETKKVYQGEGYEITVEEQSSWQDGSVAEVVVENTGSRTIRNWQILSWFSGGTVANAWNAEWVEKDQTITFSYQEFNRSIEPGEKVTFGYQMDRGHLGDLDKMKLVLGKQRENQPEEYSVSYRIVNQWDGHAVIEAEIYNHSDRTIDDWQLSFHYTARITNIWNAKILVNRSGTYKLANMDYNARIRAGEKICFGFEAEFSGEEITCPEKNQIQSASDETAAEEITPVPPEIETGDKEDFDPETDAYIYHDVENQDWNMEMINADSDIVKKALEHPRGAVRVALLDSGVNYSDEVYVSDRKNFVPGEDEYSPLYEDVSGHGTAVAEVLASNPGGTPASVDEYGTEEKQYSDFETEDLKCEGEDDERLAGEEETSESSLFQVLDSGYDWNQGVNPTVDLISAKVLDENSETTVERVIQAIDWAIEKDSDIISMSIYHFEYDLSKLSYRVELTWEDTSLDLDSLLIVDFPSIPDDKTGNYFYMTYFVEKTFRPELGYVFQKDDRAEIVKDVRDGSEPEVTKIYELEEGGYYSFSVRNYSGKSQDLLSWSGAKVKLYKGNEKTPMYTCSVPEGKGYYWRPFLILGDSGILIPDHKLTNGARG